MLARLPLLDAPRLVFVDGAIARRDLAIRMPPPDSPASPSSRISAH